MKCFFVSDLHGKPDRYHTLFKSILKERPDSVFIGGDILPGGYGMSMDSKEFWGMLVGGIREARADNPDIRFFVILGNDDPGIHEKTMKELETEGLLDYVHQKSVKFGNAHVAGYSYVPPSPFMLKDWERYDVSRFTGVGCVSPEEGMRSIEISPEIKRYSTIQKDIAELARLSPPDKTIYLFHSPAFETCLDMLDNEGKMIDHVPADRHVGSIAMKRFIKEQQPMITLHGHIHESVRMTGCWKEIVGKTYSFGAAHDGPGLALIRFDTENLENATREIIRP